MGTELLAPLDLAFWHFESDAHPMHLGALAVFAPAPDAAPERILDLLGTRAAAIPRLRMCVRDVLLPVGGKAWTVDKDFDVHRHVEHIVVADGDFMTGAGRLAGELMERPLGRGLPPWRMYLIGGAEGGPFAVLVKLHHALADGMRAVAIGAGIFDEIAALTDARTAARGRPAVPPRSWLPDPREMAGMALGRIGEVGRALGVGASVVRAGRLDLRSTTAFTAPSSGTRRLATADLDAGDLQRIRRAEGGTANDILLAVVAGALRRWMAGRGDPLPAADPRALVPVSRRRPGGASATGNRLSAYLLGLPVTAADPRERLRAVRTAMDRNKAAGPLKGAGAVAVLADQLPPLAHRFGAPLAASAARMLFDVLVTSVPLPRSALSLGGCPLTALYPMAPLARGQSLAVALSTYGGRVHVGLVADGKALPDLDRLAAAVEEEFAELGAVITGTDRSPVS
ncbi:MULTISPECIES: wax ester/triacylglycerol synthase family O-acyltransferase [Streptomyces]|uniref:wax ester/triacylglycerol synthase family O-acyltransferase n=1 Tax=Streptomyces TaxID=1883 RepID=UPI00093BF4F2|nr:MULTISPECIES: wax ester/triacylglycerol synthase family O-acyltransferase [Streptomyces]MCX4502313.1 wax ester/triacylglycerol synthase family O-acyltransferase [Streptomyces anulatus]MCX4522890.1 wax ester/triacylglycerol synthase family O-acyltransferase [Streptomyces anulatus]MCX4605901.1 wax ester/triacylglycerol synthase family O-acyltransferase [Streptomyces anulatus]OKI55145.1 diacylglycerol O-acyltransferase [Streptomyces sp. CB00072]WSI81896.1 wax ester/triacylglycerol synthase fam